MHSTDSCGEEKFRRIMTAQSYLSDWDPTVMRNRSIELATARANMTVLDGVLIGASNIQAKESPLKETGFALIAKMKKRWSDGNMRIACGGEFLSRHGMDKLLKAVFY